MLQNTVIPERPMFKPEFPPQEVEPSVVIVDEEGKPTDRVKSALNCLPHYDPASCWSGESLPSFRYWKIRDYAYAYGSKLVTPSMVAQQIISVIEGCNYHKPPTPLLISFDAEEIRKQAAASTQRFEEGNPLSILDGIFMAIKDDIDCTPHPTKGASTWMHEVRSVEKDAISVSRLRSCGVILIGKANMHEFGMGTTGNNPNYGTTRNPHAHERYTGGSSSGPAAIVASGLCSAALGTDGGGSIRIPSSLCGVRGDRMKPGKDGEAKAVPVVIGAMVLDIQATSSIPPHPRTTCPGQVHYVQGGVARNIAECMGKLGADPFLISVLGFDMAGTMLMEHWKSANLSTEGIRRKQDIKTPTVCHILDVNGEVAAGVASVEAVEKFLTPEWFQQFKHVICSSPILMVDANLSPPALEASCRLAAESNIPVWFEPVSIAKSKRIAPIVKYVTFASPNEDELIAMANALSSGNLFPPIEKNKCSTDTLFQMLKPAIWLLLQKGIKVLVLTIGSNGVILCTKGEPNSYRIGLGKSQRCGFSQQLFETMKSNSSSNWCSDSNVLERSPNFLAVHFPALSASVVRLTGAGDCLVGGMLASLSAGLDVMQSVAIGIAAAKASVEVDSNVPSQFDLEAITGDARIVYSAAKVMQHQSKL